MQARDRQVRDHEQAHLSAAAGIAVSGPSYEYQRGPDGKNYAIGGEVRIDVSPGRSPQETLSKAQQIERAALAPRDPSSADRAVAAEASQMAQEAQSKLRAQGTQPTNGGQAADQQAGQQGSPANAVNTSGQSNAGNPQPETGNDRVSRAYAGGSDANTALTLVNAYA